MTGRRIAGTLLLAALLASVGVGVALVGASEHLAVSAADTDAEAGENVTIDVEVANEGEEATAAIVALEDAPGGWTVVDRADAGATYKESETKWLFQTIEAGETRAPAAVLSVPDDADGEYAVTVTVTDGDVEERATATVTVGAVDSPGENSTETDGADDGTTGNETAGNETADDETADERTETDDRRRTRDSGDDEDESLEDMPGFTLPVTFVALAVTAMALRRR